MPYIQEIKLVDHRVVFEMGPKKPSHAAEILKKIEVIAARITESHGENEAQNLSLLKGHALTIKTNFDSKVKNASFFARLFGHLKTKSHNVQSVYDRINQIEFFIPDEMVLQIFASASMQALGKLAQVSKQFKIFADDEKLRIARTHFNFKGTTPQEANDFLRNIYQALKTLNVSPRDDLVNYISNNMNDLRALLKQNEGKLSKYQVIVLRIALGVNLDKQVDSCYSFPCVRALMDKDYQLLKLMVVHGADVNAPYSPFLFYTDSAEEVEYLLRNKASPTTKLRNRYHLEEVISYSPEKAEAFIKVYLKLENEGVITLTPEYKHKILVRCIEQNHKSAFKTMLESASKLDCTSPNGHTLTHHAAYYDRVDMLDQLLNLGAPANVGNAKGETPLMMVHSLEAAQKLVAKDPSSVSTLDDRNNSALYYLYEISLHRAYSYDHEVIADFLIGKGANVNILLNNKPLLFYRGNPETLEVLLCKGANPETRYNNQLFPTSFILDDPKKALIYVNVYLRLENEGKIALSIRFKLELMLKCIKHNRYEIFKVLLESGANLDTAYPDINLVSLAANLNNRQVVADLLENGAPYDIADDNGKTPLMLTTSLEVAKLLVANDKSVMEAVDNHGQTALFYAHQRKDWKLIDLLHANGGTTMRVSRTK